MRTGRIPKEVISFFHAPGGHSLIVKGPAGTGKPTFALQLTEELNEVAASHYLSSRVSDESLYNQFPWLRDRLKPAVIQTAPSTSRGSKVERRGGRASPRGPDLPDLEAAYDFVDRRLPKRSIVLIDSIDALAEHYGVPASRLI